MRVLALDSTGPYCTVALCDTAKVLAYKTEKIDRGHAERLAPMVAEVLGAADLTPKNVDKLAVCTGPGSFTGTRVALAFAKGFALPRKLPVIGLSSHAILAAHFDPESAKNIVTISDVRRGELSWAAIFKSSVIQAPITQSKDIARKAIEALDPDNIIEDGIVDGRILAWLAASLRPSDFPAAPLYSRGPDAKLPGGLNPK